MDSFEFNKIAGAVLATLLVILGGNKLLDIVYEPKPLATKAYVVEGVVEDSAHVAAGPAAPAEPAVPLATLLAGATPEAGEKVSKQCISCHTFEKGGANKTGPNLWGVIGAKFGQSESYTYSSAFQAEHASGRVWDYETLNRYLENPKSFVPGNKMAFAGLKKPQARADVIAYLRSMMDNPPPLPTPPAAPAPGAADAAPAAPRAPAH